MKSIILLENIRSAYNVGAIIRTADALCYDIWCIGYTPSPFFNEKVHKTSLQAQNHISIKHFSATQQALTILPPQYTCVVAEIHPHAISLQQFIQEKKNQTPMAIVFGNEVNGVTKQSCDRADYIVYIPMQGHKESLNVAQTAAIYMRAMSQSSI